jgi:predicted phage terminase large subunit-like protein
MTAQEQILRHNHPSQLLVDAAAELLRRKRIRSSLVEYARSQGFEPAKHHLIIINHLEMICNDQLDLLLIFAPPGSAKSSYVSVLFPAYYLANHPTHQYLAATHSADFAARWGRKVRNDLMNPENAAILGINISPDSAAQDHWSLVQGGVYFGVGAGAGISGIRADVAVIDDPFGSREDAYSPQVRQKRWDWYVDDFSARMKPTAKRVIMATRWHEDDISGRILRQLEKERSDGDVKANALRFKVLSFPAIAETMDDPVGRKPGEYLWDDPTGYDYGRYLRQRQRESSPMMWSALFQQRPAPESGDYFREEWIKPIKHPPDKKELRIYGASDYAVTKDDGDFTAHIVVGVDHEGKMYLLDLWRSQESPDIWIEKFCSMVKKWNPLEWGEEVGQIKASVGPFLSKRQQETEAYVFRRPFPHKGDKSVRAQSIRGRMAIEGLYVDFDAEWFPSLRGELLSFPAGKNDDQVDALSLIGLMLDHITPADSPPPPPPKPRYLQDITLDELWEHQPTTNKFGTRI